MASIIGRDVHTTNFMLCCYMVDSEREFATVQTKPDYHEILKHMDRIRKPHEEDYQFVCGYEAGCWEYFLHNQAPYSWGGLHHSGSVYDAAGKR